MAVMMNMEMMLMMMMMMIGQCGKRKSVSNTSIVIADHGCDGCGDSNHDYGDDIYGDDSEDDKEETGDVLVWAFTIG